MKVNSVLEGSNITVNCRDFYSKMLHSQNSSITTIENTRIEALYTSNTCIESDGGINIDLIRGNVLGKSTRDIFLKGIDGVFNAESTNGRIELQINKLAGGSKSRAHASHGNVLVKVDPKVQLQSLQTVLQKWQLVIFNTHSL